MLIRRFSALGRTASIAAILLVSSSFAGTNAESPQTGLSGYIRQAAGTATIVDSDLDTLRFLDEYASVGDTFTVDLDVVNIDTLGAYAIRVVYDPSVIEPLTDTIITTEGTLYFLEVDQLRGTAFEKFAGTVNFPGAFTMLAADFDADTATSFRPGSGVSAQFSWRVLPDADTGTTYIAFQNDPQFPESFNAMTNFYGQTLVRPVLTAGQVHILPEPCNCPYVGDMNADLVLDAIDLNGLIDILFFNAWDITDPNCPLTRADWDCSGAADAVDLNAAIERLFFNGPVPCDPCL